MRQRISRLVRKTLSFSKKTENHVGAIWYFIHHYNASLALCGLKGYSTKDHSATLLILIREFYKKGLEKEEIEVIGNISIEKEEVLYYVEARNKRKKAGYSTKINLEKKEVELLRLKAISFVNKAKEIIESAK